jgi:hypothetical protein
MRKRFAVASFLVVLFLLVGMVDVFAGTTRGLHVERIDVYGLQSGSPNLVRARVYVRSEYNKAVKGVSVSVLLTAPGEVEWKSATTDYHGRASFTMQSNYEGLWVVCVQNLAKAHYEYQWWNNHDLCDSVWYP